MNHEDISDITGKARAGLKALAELLTSVRAQSTTAGVGELAATVVNRLQLIELAAQEGSVEAEGRIENMRELLAATAGYSAPEGEDSLRSFLQEVSLITDIDEAEMGGSMVTLMTLHCAKGLEFPVVYIVGLEDGLLPWRRSLENQEELEEERRLMYVGMTRAKERLFLTWAHSRFQAGMGAWGGQPSRFLDELPQECVGRAASGRSAPRSGIPWIHRPRPTAPTPVEPGEAVLDYETSQLPVGAILALGKLVEHAKWGPGMVVSRRGEGKGLIVDVRFADGAVRRIKAYGGELRTREVEESD
jgi:DNA helicase-2/ATP-dependent DNA helicase PcrA